MFLNNYGISNFKCFKDITNIGCRPITINIGPNNSGKSSLLKSLNLLKHSLIENQEFNKLRTFKNVHILREINSFYYSNIGTANDFLYNSEKELSFNVSIPNLLLPKKIRKEKVQIELFYSFQKGRLKSNIEFNLGETTYGVKEEPEISGVLTKYIIKINDLPILTLKSSEEYYIEFNDSQKYFGEIEMSNCNFIREGYLNESEINIYDIPKLIREDWTEDTFTNIEKLPVALAQTFKRNINFNSKNIVELLKSCLIGVVEFQNEIVKMQFVDLERKVSKRYIDKDNNSLFKSLMDLYFNPNKSENLSVDSTLKRILPLLGLPDKFRFVYQKDFGFQFMLKLENGTERNLIDYGSGINQLLPLLIAASSRIKGDATSSFQKILGIKKLKFYINSLLVIEEPESNLHPAMQSNLADVLVLLNKERNLDFIIETHSEYMVRKFQYLVASKELKKEHIIINYFWDENGVKRCKQIEFEENGSLSDSFEGGFYDVADSIALDLFISNFQQN